MSEQASTRTVTQLAPVGGALATLVALYLATYLVHRFVAPLGWDTPGYVWRTGLIRAFGVRSLPSHVVPPGPAHQARMGFVAVGGVLTSATGSPPLRVTEVMPALMAGATGLAAGALASTTLRREAWYLALIAVAVGASVFVVHLVNVESYLDTAILAPVFVAALVFAVGMPGRRGLLMGATMLAACALIHWSFFEVGAGVVLGTALAFSPSLRHGIQPGRREGITLRLVVIVAAGAVLGAAVIYRVLGAHPSPVDFAAQQFANKLHRDLPALHLVVVVPLALLGVWVLAREGQGPVRPLRPRLLLVVLLVWALTAVAAAAAEAGLGWVIPTHRVLSFDLALPLLAAVGVLGAATWLATRWGGAGRALAALVVAGALGSSVVVAEGQWLSFRPVMDARQVEQAAAVDRYLDAAGIPTGRPLVFVVDHRTTAPWDWLWLTGHDLRAGLSPKRVLRSYLFVGSPEGYLARAPSTYDPPGTVPPSPHDRNAEFFLRAMLDTYSLDPVAVVLSSTSPDLGRWTSSHPDLVLAPGVAVVRGPVPGPDARSAAARASKDLGVGPASPFGLTWLAAEGLLLLLGVGGGWTWFAAHRRLRSFEIAALAPAVGIAVLVLGTILLSAAGIPMRGPGAWLIVASVGTLGWVPCALTLGELKIRRGRAGLSHDTRQRLGGP